MNSNIIEKANRLVVSSDTAYIAVIDENNYPSVSTITPIKADGFFELYFSTGINVNKTRRILKNNRVSICYNTKNDNVSLVGRAEILTDKATKHELWQDWFINHFSLGKDDPEYCIIKFTSERVSLWIDRESSEFFINDLMRIQSSCGLLCDGCDFKETHGCGGCIETKGHPFYGECHIASCCQEKGYNHCGECSEMPCKELHDYSCGDFEHCDNPKGARINILKCWEKRSIKVL